MSNANHPKCTRCKIREAWYHIGEQRSCVDCLTPTEKREIDAARLEALSARDLVEPHGGNI